MVLNDEVSVFCFVFLSFRILIAWRIPVKLENIGSRRFSEPRPPSWETPGSPARRPDSRWYCALGAPEAWPPSLAAPGVCALYMPDAGLYDR